MESSIANINFANQLRESEKKVVVANDKLVKLSKEMVDKGDYGSANTIVENTNDILAEINKLLVVTTKLIKQIAMFETPSRN